MSRYEFAPGERVSVRTALMPGPRDLTEEFLYGTVEANDDHGLYLIILEDGASEWVKAEALRPAPKKRR